MWCIKSYPSNGKLSFCVFSSDAVKYLTLNAKDPEAKNLGNYDKRTALHIAALTNNLQLCKILKDAGADINARMKFKVRKIGNKSTQRIHDTFEKCTYLDSFSLQIKSEKIRLLFITY